MPGVYDAGDVSRDVRFVAVAVGEGAKAAVAINKAFRRRGGLSDYTFRFAYFLLRGKQVAPQQNPNP